jgi:hypothetical protein
MLAVLLLPAAAGPARAADEPPPSDLAAVDAYRETIPTASGAKPVGAQGAPATPLPAAVEERLRTQKPAAAKMLRRIATEPRLGAERSTPFEPADRAEARPKSENPVFAAVGSVAEGSAADRRLLALLVAMGAIAFWGVAAAIVRARAITPEQQ